MSPASLLLWSIGAGGMDGLAAMAAAGLSFVTAAGMDHRFTRQCRESFFNC